MTPLVVFAACALAAPQTLDGCQAAPDGVIELERKNLLDNASFEWDAEVGKRGVKDGFAFRWGLWGRNRVYGLYNQRSTPSFDPDAVHGARSQKIVIRAHGRDPLLVIQDAHHVVTGRAYTFSAHVRVDEPRRWDVYVGIEFRKGRHKAITHANSPKRAPTRFERLSVSAVAPEGVDRARCTVYFAPKADGAAGTVWVDAAQCEAGDRATEYTPCYAAEAGEAVSAPIDLSGRGAPYKLSWIAAQPSATQLRFQLRSADTREALAKAQWLGPVGGEHYGTTVPVGPNLLDNPSLETLDPKTKLPAASRHQGYGPNGRKLEVVADAHSGKRALKATVTQYKGGNARWNVWCDGPFEPNGQYAFSVWHRENSDTTPVYMCVAFQDKGGATRWGRFRQDKPASATWRRDTIGLRVPPGVQRVYLELCLGGVGWAMADDYCLRRATGDEQWPVNPAHRSARWLQYRAQLRTSDLAQTPKLFSTRVECGPAVPEVRWLNVFAQDERTQCYSFNPGQGALFRAQVVDFTGAADIQQVRLALVDPSGRRTAPTGMKPGRSVSDTERVYEADHRFPADAALGEWRAEVDVLGRSGGRCTETAILKVRRPYTKPSRRMLIGALVDDYGFRKHKGEALEQLIARYRQAKGLEIWKLSFCWDLLEPRPGVFNADMIAGLKTFVAAAHQGGAGAQIGIQQQLFPEWVNNGAWDSPDRYQCGPTCRLARTWRRVAAELKDLPGLESYLLVNEENAVRDADVYLRAMAKVHAAVRAVDPNPKHRIVVRPNTRDPYLRTRIAMHGAFDYDYGSGGYPTSAAWFFMKYAHPISQTSCMGMSRFRAAPVVYGGPGGIGEIGFYRRRGVDRFGDEARLAGFQRAMRIAYEMGMDEFQLWGGGFSFDDLATYCPKLVAFRDRLLEHPRPVGFDVAVVMERDERLYHQTRGASALDMGKQPLATLFRFLDEGGYVWYYTRPDAMAIQRVKARAIVKTADLKGKSPAEQRAWLAKKLQRVRPSGTALPWPENVE